MSDLDNAITTINAAAEKTEKNATFLDDWSTLGDTASVTNPNNGKIVPSAQKKIKDLYDANATEIAQAVADAESASDESKSARDEAVTAAAGVGGVEERLLGVGSSLYKGSNGSYVQNGDTVPVGTTHLTILINGKAETFVMIPFTSGVVSGLTETSATIGGAPTILKPAKLNSNSVSSVYDSWDGASSISNAVQSINDSYANNDRFGCRPELYGNGQGDPVEISSEMLLSNGIALKHFHLTPVASAISVFRSELAYRSSYEDITIIGATKNDNQVGIDLDGYASPISFSLYGKLNHLRLANLSTGVRRKGGWGNGLRKSDITACGTGIQYINHPATSNWASSGDCHAEVNTSGCDIGVDNGWGWANTYINHIFESNVLGFKSNGPSPVLINPWFESNATNVDSGQGVVCIGGAGLGATNNPQPLSWSSTAMYESRQVHTVLDSYGINMFRDENTQTMKVTGVGVEKLYNYGTQNNGNMDIWGAAISGNDGITIRGRYTNLAVTPQSGDQQSDLANTSIAMTGENAGTGGNGGRGVISFGTGTLQADGTYSIPLENEWEITQYYTGSLYRPTLRPVKANCAIGSPANPIDDLYVNNAPTVGSDERIKLRKGSIPQELCDFAMSVEFVQYEIKGEDNSRNHFGIIIDDEFITALSSVYAIDDCAAICHDIFTDEDGEPITKSINTVELGDIWRVRYDEWQNIILEAMRRKINAM